MQARGGIGTICLNLAQTSRNNYKTGFNEPCRSVLGHRSVEKVNHDKSSAKTPWLRDTLSGITVGLEKGFLVQKQSLRPHISARPHLWARQCDLVRLQLGNMDDSGKESVKGRTRSIWSACFQSRSHRDGSMETHWLTMLEAGERRATRIGQAGEVAKTERAQRG